MKTVNAVYFRRRTI